MIQGFIKCRTPQKIKVKPVFNHRSQSTKNKAKPCEELAVAGISELSAGRLMLCKIFL